MTHAGELPESDLPELDLPEPGSDEREDLAREIGHQVLDTIAARRSRPAAVERPVVGATERKAGT